MDLEGFTVILVRSKATHVWHKGMKNVITALKNLGLHPDWQKPEEILDMTLTNKTVLIMADFSCDHFNDFCNTDCLVVGPDCLLECIDKKISIPDNGSAVYNMAMSDLVITATNMPKKKKEELKKYVGWMGGCYTSTFTLAHTHLLAETVNSEKCYAAGDNKKPIMNPDWVMKVWEASLEDTKLRADSEDLISTYRLPALKGLEITLSNLNTAVKRKYKKMIEENGGLCVGSLTQKQTHFVVTDKCEGEKVKCALAWGGVHVVNPQWLEKSVEMLGPLSPQPYLFKQRPTCSTPTSELPSFMSAADISAVGAGNSTTGSQRIEETLNNTAQSAASVASYIPVARPKAIRPPPASVPVVPPTPAPEPNETPKTKPSVSEYDKYKQIIEDLKPADISKAGSFLDGCKIYLSGWCTSEGDKLRRLLIKAGATVLTKVQRGVTHIVAAQLPPDHDTLTNSGSHNIVSLDWVLASKEKGQPAEVSPYLMTSSQSKPPPPSPLSSKGLELLKSRGLSSQDNGDKTNGADLMFQPPVSRKLFEKTPKKKLLSHDVCELNLSNGESSHDAAPLAAPVPHTSSQSDKDSNTTNTQKSTMSDTTNVKVFQGMVFTILGFDAANAADIVTAIEGLGGSIVPQSFQGIPDYAVLPIEGVPDKFTATEVVNALWIEECLDQGSLVDIQYYHQPISIRAPGVPLSSAIICLSGFPPKEKLFLFHVASILGAQVQEAFSRKDNPAKGVLRSTHLISSEPSGSKYEAAIKWGIPVVSRAWLTEAAIKSTDSQLPPHQPYSLTKILPNQDDIETTPMTSKSAKSNCSMTPINRVGSQLPRTTASQLGSVRPSQSCRQETTTNAKPTSPSEQDIPEQGLPPAKTPDYPQSNYSLNENHTPVATKTVSLNKDSRASSSMFPTPGGDELNKFNVSLNSSTNTSGLKRRSGDRSPLREQNSPATPLLLTPLNHLPKMARLSDSSLGRSPFHVDTPETPLGKVLYSNPDKNTTKLYKKFIDSFPDFKQDTPLQHRVKSSPPIHVLRKQILAQLGDDVDGIEKGTGKLLKNGIYSEWANSSVDSSFSSPAAAAFSDGSKVIEETPMTKKKSPGNDKKAVKSSRKSDKVNELMHLMAEIQKNSDSGDQDEIAQPRMEQKILERLQAVPNQEQNDIKSHPLNKIRPNAEPLFDAEKPSTSSLDKGDRNKTRAELNLSVGGDLCSPLEPEEEDTQPFEDGTPTQPVPKKFFMLSSLPVDWKEKYEGLIRGLGGEVLSCGWYEDESTHLVIETPVRNEKLLGCIASGKWVLHTSYLDQCYERRCFVPEDAYEWGNPLSESRLPKLEPGSAKEDLAKAAYRWRRNCSNLNQKAFRQMKVTLICREQSKAMFTRLLRAGGAHILEDLSKCNICLVEEGKVELETSMLESLASRSVPCVPLIYLNAYLTNYPKVNPADYLIQQYIPIYKNRQNLS